MKYLCLIYDSEAEWAAMPDSQTGPIMDEYRAFTESIIRSGQFVAGEQLQPTAAATSVRIRGGKTVITDGPFAETKEQLGGFYLIEARDLNEAIQIASRIPSAKLGTIEVRPIVPSPVVEALSQPESRATAAAG